LSEDPIMFLSGDSNFYRYVFNRQEKLNDPYGLWGVMGGSGGTAGIMGSVGCNFFEGSGGIALDFGTGEVAGFASIGMGKIFGASISGGPFAGIFIGDIASLSGKATNFNIITPWGTLTFTTSNNSLIAITLGRGGFGGGIGVAITKTTTQIGSLNGNSSGEGLNLSVCGGCPL